MFCFVLYFVYFSGSRKITKGLFLILNLGNTSSGSEETIWDAGYIEPGSAACMGSTTVLWRLNERFARN